MSNYLIKLFPVGKFFFGGDMTFSVGTKDLPKERDKRSPEILNQVRFNNRYASYIIQSEKFPQQTSLLGMLRFFLLRNEEGIFNLETNKIKDPNNARKLIGERSFAVGGEGGYGCIKGLSPCFLMKGGQIITRMPMDHSIEEISLVNQDNQKRFYNSTEIAFSTIKIKSKEGLKDYNAKDGDVSSKYGYYSDVEKKNIILDEVEIFIEDLRIGINRDIVTGHTEENALFKQMNYFLADGFCFAFYAQIDKDISSYFIKDGKPISQVVSLGADSSQFIIIVDKIDTEDGYLPNISLPVTNVKLNAEGKKVVLTSPAFIEESTIEKSCFHIATTIPFKHMVTDIKCKSYHRLSGIGHSKKVELFQTGSVFYFKSKDDADCFEKKIKAHEDYYQIGYNHCQVTD